MKRSVLIVDDDWVFLETLARSFSVAGARVAVGSKLADIAALPACQRFDSLVIEPSLPGSSWFSVMSAVFERRLATDVVVVTAYPSRALASLARAITVRSLLRKP